MMKKLLLLARGLEAENNFDLEEYKMVFVF